MKFTKMHGCGNDYIYVNCMEKMVKNPEKVAIYVSDRHFGIGSDGLILICPSKVADFRMAMYNADGSEGKMCGNGVRCIAKYVYEYGLTDKDKISIETKGGIKYLDLTIEDGKVVLVKVNMGAPILEPKQIPVTIGTDRCVNEAITVDGKEYYITCVSMGNPHAVTFVDDTDSLPLEQLGPHFEKHEAFPDRVNTEFVQVLNRKEVKMRVWERGTGVTMACGTGTCATVVAAILNGLVEKEAEVILDGGNLHISWEGDSSAHVFMTGPAEKVFEGEYII